MSMRIEREECSSQGRVVLRELLVDQNDGSWLGNTFGERGDLHQVTMRYEDGAQTTYTRLETE